MHPKLVEITQQRKVLMDGPTALVIAAMVVGFPLIGWAQVAGHLPWWATLIIGTALMNLSFTAWHESSHGSFSKIGWINTAAGIVASAASVYPGYFARRREHLIHHKWEGQDGKDPVYPRIQTSFLGFAFRLARLTVQGVRMDIPESFQPMTPTRIWADRASNFFALAIVLAGALAGWDVLWAVLCAWIIPRAIVLFLHAYYICFLPHNVPEGGYTVLRVRDAGWVGRLVTIDQSMHGIHHLWPFIPWHRYRAVLKDPDLLAELKAARVEFQTGMSTATPIAAPSAAAAASAPHQTAQ
ncbi:MAG: fatty acid desaturase family protein [Rhodospirillaceae bacterium]